MKKNPLIDKATGNPVIASSVDTVSKNAPASGVLSNVHTEKDEKSQLDQRDLDDMVTQINTALQNERRSIQFNVDEDSGRTVIKIIDAKSGDQIKQIPAEELLRISRQMAEQLDQDDITGMLVQGRV
ncbi:flagellar protein FlaG [Methylotuvimicrobium buryatense]|uniref:Flagellar protein FlaG n=1 Tax=Methylotuvimicrobium buryatense TaxID=95641 RepID=A0A4P9UQZ3_METBY|nr:flagellar protein FlaG [Methylotuvimicrobium buryatense]QCW83868.1 flagellar protein FlaG [Methylotuvimicrobium buryatense]